MDALNHQIHSQLSLNRAFIYAKLIASKLLDKPLSLVHTNPFVHDYRWSTFEFWRVYTFGVLAMIVRLPVFLLLMFTSCVLAKGFVIAIEMVESLDLVAESIRIVGRWLCFMIIRAALFIVGFYWIRYIDRRPDRTRLAPIIVVAPHTSFFDVLVMMKLRNPTFVSKIENRDIFLFGNVLKLCRGIYVNRNESNSREKTKLAIRDRALDGENVLIFPEGTCHNRAGLLEYKVGAFMPGLPVTPVLVRWDVGDVDTITWTWEGPEPWRVFLHALTRISINMEVSVLPTYTPSEQERSNAKLFAGNVEKWMCAELGVCQWYYSFDDVSFFFILRQMNQFASPSCNLLLKLVAKLIDNPKVLPLLRVPTLGDDRECSPVLATPSQLSVVESVLSIGEDVDHPRPNVSDDVVRYVPKNFKASLSSKEKENPDASRPKKSLKSPPLVERSERLGVSKTKRRYCKTTADLPTADKLPPSKQMLFENYVYFIQHSIRKLEKNFEYRAIESSEDLIQLLDLDHYTQTKNVAMELKLTSLVVKLLQVLEHTVEGGPPTTLHLLAVLHLNDLRESEPWERIRVVMRLLQRARHQAGGLRPGRDTPAEDVHKPKLVLEDYRTLVWYVLGVQVSNHGFFRQQYFDFDFVRHHLQSHFTRALLDNAPHLVEDL